MLIFTDRQQVYKCRISDFEDSKASVLGTYLPAHLSFDEGESVFCAVLPGDYSGQLLMFFENGKAARVELNAYATKTNRRKLTGAYSDKSPLRSLLVLTEERDIAVYSTEGRALIINSGMLAPKATRNTQGVGVMTMKSKYKLDRACFLEETQIKNVSRYRMRSIPAVGALLREEDRGEEQMTLLS